MTPPSHRDQDQPIRPMSGDSTAQVNRVRKGNKAAHLRLGEGEASCLSSRCWFGFRVSRRLHEALVGCVGPRYLGKNGAAMLCFRAPEYVQLCTLVCLLAVDDASAPRAPLGMGSGGMEDQRDERASREGGPARELEWVRYFEIGVCVMVSDVPVPFLAQTRRGHGHEDTDTASLPNMP